MPGIDRYVVTLCTALACIFAATHAVAAQTCSEQQTACNQFLATNHSTFFNTNSACSGTELRLYGRVGSGGSPGGCLACAFTSGCLDDTFVQPDGSTNTDNECEDLSGSQAIAQCLTALSCDLGVNNGCPSVGEGYAPAFDPATQSGPVNNAFCGTGVSTADCTSNGPSGVCARVIKAGYPADSSSTSNILLHLTDPTFSTGQANKIAACTLANCAQECFASTATSVPALGSRANGQLGLLALSLSLLSIGLFAGFGRRSSQA